MKKHCEIVPITSIFAQPWMVLFNNSISGLIRLLKTGPGFALVLWLAIGSGFTLVAQEHVADDSKVLVNCSFDGKISNAIENGLTPIARHPKFVRGVSAQSLNVDTLAQPSPATLTIDNISFATDHSFSMECWIRSTAKKNQQFVVLGNKAIKDFSLKSQKQKGWCFGVAHGTWMWNIGTGKRRLTYHRENGRSMPVNDGRWHQFAMTYDHQSGLIRLYYDGDNWVTYNVKDNGEFDFSSRDTVLVGPTVDSDSGSEALDLIQDGAGNLQKFVDEFGRISERRLKTDELVDLVVSPSSFCQAKNPAKFDVEAGKKLESLARGLMENPYTIHQAPSFMEVAPLAKIYRVTNGKVEIAREQAAIFANKTKLDPGQFSLDELVISRRVFSSQQISDSYTRFFQSKGSSKTAPIDQITAGAFNIFHGGIHFSIEEHGWDSRQAIVDLIKRENVDLIMMQETYSHGDFIASELGFYFATTIDWDYLNQGANISVISRYPIEEITVPPNSAFMNVAAKVKLTPKQAIFVMSNWYGMRNFKDVFSFHQSKFDDADNVPILFGGDFNSVPDSDGGDNLASRILLKNGFVDAFRESFPNASKQPGHTHRSGNRIDQIYFKGKSLEHLATNVLSDWPSGFPSDHYLIKSDFKLKPK